MSEAPLKLLSSMAVRTMLQVLVEDYQRQARLPVQLEADGGVKVVARMRAGERLDIVVLSQSAIDELIAAGRVLAGSRVDLARSGIAVAVRAGASQPDIGSADAVRRAVLNAGSIGYSTGPSGRYLEELFARWDVLESVRNRISVAPPGMPVGSMVASGAVELGFQQLSELLDLPGIAILGPLPDAIQNFTTFSGGIASESDQPAAARSLLEYLASSAHTETKRRCGMESA